MSVQKKYKGVLFDLDGTLVDNYTAIHSCLSATFAESGIPAPTYDKVIHSVGGSILITVKKVLAGSGDEERAEALAARYLELFPKYVFEGLSIIPYAADILSALKTRGLRLACFTNKQRAGAMDVLGKLGLSEYLDAIVATSLNSPRKPEPEFTRMGIAALGLSAGEVVGIGDSLYDYKAALAGGIDSAIVATGADSRESLAAECPLSIGVYSDLKELAPKVFGITL